MVLYKFALVETIEGVEKMIGVVLAGGEGTRLQPLTYVTNKHLLPVYDKPMIAYPLQYLLSAGIEDIFVVTGGKHFDAIGRLLGSGKDVCKKLSLEGRIKSLDFAVQDGAGGIAEALGLARRYVGTESVAVVLGDNIFEDQYVLRDAVQQFTKGANIFLKDVPDENLYEHDPKKGINKAKYGMAELDGQKKVLSIEEKPEVPKSNYAVTGAYLYDSSVFTVIPTLTPSGRGELEITDVNNYFVNHGSMNASRINGWWTDAGSIQSLHRAGNLVYEQF